MGERENKLDEFEMDCMVDYPDVNDVQRRRFKRIARAGDA